MKPLFVDASYYETIWGGNYIASFRGIEGNIGSFWEVSAHENGPCTVSNVEGHPTLLSLIQSNPEEMLGKGYTLHEMLRTAFLDTQDNLSIQVHPYDEYALEHSDDNGKYESWYIVYAKPGTYLVAGTTTEDANVIRNALENGTLDQYLKKWYVKTGDYITIPMGMLHALGKDMVAYEIGTNSDTTYRFYDYDRVDAQGNKRPLNVEDSFNVADFSLQPVFVPAKKESRRIGDTPYFTVDEIYNDQDQTFECEGHFFLMTNVSEKETEIIWNNESMKVPGYQSIFVPASASQVILKKNSHMLISRAKREDQ